MGIKYIHIDLFIQSKHATLTRFGSNFEILCFLMLAVDVSCFTRSLPCLFSFPAYISSQRGFLRLTSFLFFLKTCSWAGVFQGCTIPFYKPEWPILFPISFVALGAYIKNNASCSTHRWYQGTIWPNNSTKPLVLNEFMRKMKFFFFK